MKEILEKTERKLKKMEKDKYTYITEKDWSNEEIERITKIRWKVRE